MSRFVLSFAAAALVLSLVWIALFPNEGLLQDSGMMALGFVAIFLLGFDIFIRALAPTREESSGIDTLLVKVPAWKPRLVWIGIAAGAVSVVIFFIVAKRSDSILVAGIPIGVFFVAWFGLQHVVPKLFSVVGAGRHHHENKFAEQGDADQPATAVESKIEGEEKPDRVSEVRPE